MQWQVALNNDSFDRAGITKDCQDAVSEYIWNRSYGGFGPAGDPVSGK